MPPRPMPSKWQSPANSSIPTAPPGRGVGENLWMGTHGAFGPEAMVGGWASEKRLFVPGIFPNNSRSGNWSDVGHYTQMVWPTTLRVGCALASTPRTDYLVCRYALAGNIDGRWVGPQAWRAAASAPRRAAPARRSSPCPGGACRGGA